MLMKHTRHMHCFDGQGGEIHQVSTLSCVCVCSKVE